MHSFFYFAHLLRVILFIYDVYSLTMGCLSFNKGNQINLDHEIET